MKPVPVVAGENISGAAGDRNGRNTKNLLQPLREQPLRVLPLSVFGIAFAQLTFHWSLDYASVVQVATMVTIIPIFVVFLRIVMRLFSRETGRALGLT